MDAGYSILLKHVQKLYRPIVFQSPPLPIPEDFQLSELTVFGPDEQADKTEATCVNDKLNNVREETALGNKLPQALWQPLLVLFLLVPGFLLFVDHVRQGDSHDMLLPNWRGQDQDHRFGRGEENPAVQVSVDVPGSDPLLPATTPPAVVVVGDDDAVEVPKCEGWRDWIDYEGGWKGCVP